MLPDRLPENLPEPSRKLPELGVFATSHFSTFYLAQILNQMLLVFLNTGFISNLIYIYIYVCVCNIGVRVYPCGLFGPLAR